MVTQTKRRIHAVAHGPRIVPAPRTALDASTFNGTYLRPNLSNAGTVPAQGPYSTCPDIYPAGTTPVAHFQTALATTQSYQTDPPDQITLGYDNYIYVRGLNGASTNRTNTVQLYYAPNAIIQWPGQWQNNTIQTDQGNTQANITNLAPGQIGVADQTFLWKDVQPPPSGSNHYCLFAQFNDANNSNPFPAVYTQLDMATLISTNLGWGWRNVALVSAALPTWQYEMGLTIPQNVPTTANYFVYVTPTGFTGWQVAFNCSQLDVNGKAIILPQQTILQNGALMGVTCSLAPGFNAIVTIYMFQGHAASNPGATIPLGCSYQTASPSEAEEAVRRGIVDGAFMRKVQRAFGPEIGPTPWVGLGAQTYRLVPPGSAAVRSQPKQARRAPRSSHRRDAGDPA